MASVLRQEAGPRPGASRARRLLLEVEGPSSSEHDSPVSLGDSSRFLAGQWAPEALRRSPLGLGVRVRPEGGAAWVALRSGGEDSSPASHSVASPGSRGSEWCGGEKGPGGLVGPGVGRGPLMSHHSPGAHGQPAGRWEGSSPGPKRPGGEGFERRAAAWR